MYRTGLVIILIFSGIMIWHTAGRNVLPEKSVSVLEFGSVSIGSADSSLAGTSIPDSSVKAFYAFDKKTGFDASLFDTKKMSEKNLHINTQGNGPKILIFHTHASEMYADSKDVSEGIIEAGEHLKSVLEDRYGVECLHITDRFDVEDGKPKRDGAYERAEPVIAQIIAENPSIQLVIDLHRDGVNENLRLATKIDGKPYAKIMLFNGICRKWEDGKLVKTDGLDNPYLDTNLALSYQMQYALSSEDSTLCRKIYINAYRYSLHMKDKSMLIELGAQTNTREEALNSVEKIAEAIAKVCL